MAFDAKAYMKEYKRFCTDANRKAGICIVCGKEKAVEGLVSCEKCRERHKEYLAKVSQTPEYRKKQNKWRRERYHMYISQGLCGYCGKPIFRGNVCKHCYILKKRQAEKRRQKRIEERQTIEYETGRTLCQKCNKPALEGKKLCQHHYDIVMKYSVPKANEATRRILADALRKHKSVKWAIFKEIVMGKKA